MGRWKIPLVTLLALALLIVFACFPGIAAVIQDWQNMREPSFGEMHSIRLDIGSGIAPLGKLAMLSRMDASIEIPENAAALTSAEVETLAYEAIMPFVKAGMADPFHKVSVEYQSIVPRLAQVTDEPELSGIFWDVVISADSTAFYEFNIAVDDETGKILLVNFASDYVISPNEFPYFLETFAYIYFTGLGIEDYGDFATRDLVDQYVGDTAMAVRYRFGDAEYGEINVDLYMYPNGFYITFPS